MRNEVVVAPKLLRNGSLNALPGNRYVLNNRRIVGRGVFFAVCSEATWPELTREARVVVVVIRQSGIGMGIGG
jgi:hypothetical protein